MISTTNFNPGTDPKLLCTCGHDKCDHRSVKQWVLDRVQQVRDDYGPMTITSGGRCQYHPNEIHRVAPADHQKCIVVDVAYETEQQRNQLMVLAGRHGATAVAAGKNFVHMAWRDVDSKRVRTWVY